ncbi:hypothetical protein GA0074695_1536 [Micromonospora viridifaciens]|uniref:Uncharacterized protein n=1 Tax=Micromonospora viridifaciens TaxID=1881 RepID=A0A1C4VJP2_MICVI|nr:hypothetical protein [Micromonospora viridifaciens]SCE84222.1 hypothetical protein GA0074695_1536 [Micromonospora viridifaciens]
MPTCTECPRTIEQTPGARARITCGPACRKRRQRRLHAEREARFRAAALELLTRQTAAIIDGNREALIAVERDAARLFGT